MPVNKLRKSATRSNSLKSKCKIKDLKAIMKCLALFLIFNLLFLVVLFTNCAFNLLLLKEDYLHEVHFLERQITLLFSDTFDFL